MLDKHIHYHYGNPKFEREIMASLAELKDAVAANTSVIESAKALISGLAQKLQDAIAANDPAALDALVAELKTEDQALADAITANTSA